MADIPADTSTTVSVGIGDTYQGAIETEGDKDWVEVSLQAGVTYAFDLEGAPTNAGTLIDPYITGLYDANGTSLGKSDDDGGSGRNSELIFTPTESGTYYVELGNWINPDGSESPTGTYTFSFHEFQAPDPTPTTPAIVENVEASGTTGIDALLALTRYQNLSGGDTTHVTYSIPNSSSVFSTSNDDYGPTTGDGEPWTGLTYLTDAEQAIFHDALSQASSFAGLTFDEVPDNATSAGTVRIAWTGVADDNAAAWAYTPSGSVLAGDIWLLSQNLNSGGYGSYFNMTVLHELGHALGLKHSFEAGESGVTMPAQYEGYEYTVMSYTTSVTGDYSGASFYPTTYMYWDIKALQYLYGAIDKATGDDTYVFQNGTKYYETIWDTGGTDTYDASTQTRDVSLDLTPGSWSNVGTRVVLYGTTQNSVKTDTVFTPPEITIENATGGSGDDTLTGNDVANVLIGGAGDDTLTGGAGDDSLTGGAGADTFVYGAHWGDDVISDFVAGTDSFDFSGTGLSYDNLTITDSTKGAVISDGQGDSVTLTGVSAASLSPADFGEDGSATTGDDLITGTDGKDTIKSLAGDDTIEAGAGDDFINTSDGNDVVMSGTGDDKVFAGNGNDIVRGDGGNDKIGGAAGDDLLIGGSSNSSHFQSASADGDGADTLFGGDGADTLVGGSWTDDGDNIVEVNEVSDAAGDGANVIWAGTGADIVYGAGGNDKLGGGLGNDEVHGLGGNDVLYGGPGTAAESADTLDGGAGNDRLYGGVGNDQLTGGAGNDLIFGGDNDDVLTGDAGSDTLWGGAGADSLSGGSGTDTLNGGTGADTLDGGDDADRIVGGEGNDVLTGGAGADSFVFGAGHGDDTVTDFSVSDDMLILSNTATDFTTLASVQAAASEVTVSGQSGLMIDTGSGDSVFLVGLQISDLASMDISF